VLERALDEAPDAEMEAAVEEPTTSSQMLEKLGELHDRLPGSEAESGAAGAAAEANEAAEASASEAEMDTVVSPGVALEAAGKPRDGHPGSRACHVHPRPTLPYPTVPYLTRPPGLTRPVSLYPTLPALPDPAIAPSRAAGEGRVRLGKVG
jgi:hypothetical protein